MVEWTEAAVEQLLRGEMERPKPTPSWLEWLDPVDADVVRARLAGSPWKVVCWRYGFSRPTAHRRWQHALRLITFRLNGCLLPMPTSRRELERLARQLSAQSARHPRVGRARE